MYRRNADEYRGVSPVVTDESKANRAKTYEKQADKEQEKIRKAELLIGENRAKIEQLKRAK